MKYCEMLKKTWKPASKNALRSWIKQTKACVTSPRGCFIFKTKSGAELKGDLNLDASKKPKHMDWMHQDGILKDKTWQGIYELNGDELKICYAEADREKARPAEFATAQDSGLLLLKLKRIEK